MHAHGGEIHPERVFHARPDAAFHGSAAAELGAHGRGVGGGRGGSIAGFGGDLFRRWGGRHGVGGRGGVGGRRSGGSGGIAFGQSGNLSGFGPNGSGAGHARDDQRDIAGGGFDGGPGHVAAHRALHVGGALGPVVSEHAFDPGTAVSRPQGAGQGRIDGLASGRAQGG